MYHFKKCTKLNAHISKLHIFSRQDTTVNSLINGHANKRTPLINAQIHFRRQIATQTLIVDSLKSGQAISGPSF